MNILFMDDSPKTEVDFKIAHPAEWLKSELDMRAYLRFKLVIELLLVAVVCGTLFLMAYHKIIMGETVAAIMGALVAYCFEHWREKGKKV